MKDITKADIVKHALTNSLGTALYITVIVSFGYFLGPSFDNTKSVMVPILMFMLFVFSAAFTGSLVFGRPVIWYLDGKKREALSLLVYTLSIFLIIIAIAFFLFIIIAR